MGGESVRGMDMQRVNSRSIYSIGYDPNSQTLVIRFWGGLTYKYFGVPPSVYSQFVSASSKGRFYNSYIRGNRYLGERLN